MFFRQRATENATLAYFSGCAVGLSAKPALTIGFEKRFNPMLSMARESFVDAVTADVVPQPQDMTRILAANLRGTAPRPAHA
jgi:hydroxyacylglutathione hydrolase